MSRLFIVALAVVAQLAGTPAQADDLISRRVSYADLDLNRVEDADELIKRIERAARNVCTSGSDWIDLASRETSGVCRRDAVERAVGELNHPVVSQRFEGGARLALAEH